MKVTRVFDLLTNQLQQFPQPDCLATKINGEWVKYSTQQVLETANTLSLALMRSGIKKDDKVALISMNRPEWTFADYGIQQTGAVSVPMYPTITVEDYRYILKDSEAKLILVSTEDLYNKVKEASSDIPGVQEIYTFDHVPGAKHWSELLKMGEGQDMAALEAAKAAVKPSDLLSIIYTSGTTGAPKGVMLSHNNLVSNFTSAMPYVPVNQTHRALSFLPLCHIYERMVSCIYLSVGVSIYFAESIEKVGDNLREVGPHIFVTVPRLLEKVYDKIVAKGGELTGIKKGLFFWALGLGQKYDTRTSPGFSYDVQLKLARKLIFSKWQEALGGNVKVIVSGGAALQPRLARVFWAANIRVMEGYGLTETSPVIAVNRYEPENNVIGTVGPVIDRVEIKIAEDGEILTRSESVMVGYYKRPDLTAEVIDQDGWFHTGDIGELVEGKYLKITDRKKEMFKTSGGKYIAPQLIENKLKESLVIEQVMVVGEGEKFPGALIVPAFEGLQEWCRIRSIPYSTNEEMIRKPEVLDKFQKEIDKANESLAQYERIKKFVLLPKLWSVETGEMTPKLSIKRKIITGNNKDLIESLYRTA
ncbi:long-chain fatty acid--CoA ligase [Rufibacter glacialis]|uniref:Long-chain fatty acid--CoA ligase n=1 Tax=Rufibacter glacialis TaxID=1259555 RepID=A0A5M8Q797_9BACT|nr:long-chain fatty acid--CoA ligase [Rufibacter glacialis]KAA6431133.1 long-chain fatty acid--CoA ligase [Rufibacter glacialis]GGK84293.1 AMP-dependent synthetase [Rufibacter glacialis]